MENNTLIKTPELLDEEAHQMTQRRALISRVTKEIEGILIREKMTWGEWGEVVELFSKRIGTYIANIKINLEK